MLLQQCGCYMKEVWSIILKARLASANDPLAVLRLQLGNSLPPAVVNCDTLSVFKSRLKTHLFNTAY